jgi:hypothetical protein
MLDVYPGYQAFCMTVASLEAPSDIGPLRPTPTVGASALDRAAFLHRRADAEPSSDPANADPFKVEKEWRWSGTHCQRTALDWLAHFDAHRDEIEPALRRMRAA